MYFVSKCSVNQKSLEESSQPNTPVGESVALKVHGVAKHTDKQLQMIRFVYSRKESRTERKTHKLSSKMDPKSRSHDEAGDGDTIGNLLKETTSTTERGTGNVLAAVTERNN